MAFEIIKLTYLLAVLLLLTANQQRHAPARRLHDGRCCLDSGTATLDLSGIRVRRARVPDQLQRGDDHVLCGRLRGRRRLLAHAGRRQASFAQIRAATKVTASVRLHKSTIKL